MSNPVGRPPKYTSAEDLQDKVDQYFNELNTDKATITGLAYHLGFSCRDSFYKYGEKEQFKYAIKRAHIRIEMYYEKLLQETNVAGPIFALKNLGWKDKTESEITLHQEQPMFPDLLPERRAELQKELDERQKGN